MSITLLIATSMLVSASGSVNEKERSARVDYDIEKQDRKQARDAKRKKAAEREERRTPSCYLSPVTHLCSFAVAPFDTF